MGRIKYCCNFLTLKPEEWLLCRNTQQFQGLDIVGSHVTHSCNSYQSRILAGTKDLLQEMNKHLTRCASMCQVVSYWLLPLLTQTTEHENQGTICNIAWPALASKVLKSINTSKLLIKTQVLSDWHLVKHETTHVIFIRHCLYCIPEYIKHMGIDACLKAKSIKYRL